MIIDGNSIVNRAYYGIRPLSTAEGIPTNGIFGFMNILMKHLDEEKPQYLCVAFDLKAPTFRHKEYAEYKAQRKGMPEELAQQMPHLKELLRAMNVLQLECAGYEADDIIGTVSRICEEEGVGCAILTGDRDDLQLVSDTTRVLLTASHGRVTSTENVDRKAFEEKYHIKPEEFVDVKGLMGDTSDNIPGVLGIGEKTAMALIQKYHSIDGVYRNLNDGTMKNSVFQKLCVGREDAYMSRHLAEIVRYVPINFKVENARIKEFDTEALRKKLEELELKKIAERLGVGLEEEKAEEVEIKEADGAALERLKNEKEIFICVNEDGILFDAGGAYSCSFDDVKDILEDAEVKKYLPGYKRARHILCDRGIELKGEYYDFEIAEYVLNPSKPVNGLEELCERRNAAAAPTSLRDIFAAEMKEIDENGQRELLEEIELPLCDVLYEMETEGFLVNRDELARFGAMLGERLQALEESIYFMAGKKFNINSPKQLGEVLFEDLKLPVVKKNKRGYSTDSEVLEKLSGKHEIVDFIAEYRTLAKLKSTYADGLMEVIDTDERIRSTLNQTVTATGRISSAEPNLQNIPTRTELGREIRKMFVAKEGCVLSGADYSQIELRVLAHISGDETMIQAFLDGEDIHAITASRIFGVPQFMVTPEMRSAAKTVNFGTIYGQGEFSLAKELKISVKAAKKYIESYFEKYAGVRKYMDETIAQAKETGYVSTIFGRRRYIEELKAKNHNLVAFGERVAMNTPIQGSAADIIKIAMVRVSRKLKEKAPESHLVMQVHDELIVEGPPEEKEIVAEILQSEMEGAVKLDVPLVAEVKSGKSWYDTK
ncbi:MAG: DNA polymerase I [Clostridia bacterium]|nr:DNA polymerase I [Clostridia bacterium]